MKIVGISFLAWCQLALEIEPAIPGNLISRTRQLSTSGWLLFINSVADPNSSNVRSAHRFYEALDRTTNRGIVIHNETRREPDQS